jgi:CDP-glycerol glycerophosphotransferase (TagB/SpsB family)
MQYFLANRVGRALVRWLHAVLTPRGTFRALFERYRPSLVLATDMNNYFDMRLMQDAGSARVALVGMVRSWDNLTSKGLLRVLPNLLIVHNITEKEEAMRLHKVLESRIRVVGISHYDRYATGARTPRETFFKNLGIPSEKRLVLFAPVGDRYLSDNSVDREIVEMLDARLPDDCHLLVRLPPTDSVAALDGFMGKRVTIERPTARFKTFKNVELAPGDDEHLADTLYWTDLVVTGPSTIAIDAAFFDKPVILIGFNGQGERPYYRSIRRYYDYDHWKPVLASGGVRLVENTVALKEACAAYLADPAHDAEGRERLVEVEAYRRDGSATSRLVEVLLDTLSA